MYAHWFDQYCPYLPQNSIFIMALLKNLQSHGELLALCSENKCLLRNYGRVFLLASDEIVTTYLRYVVQSVRYL